MNNFVVEMMVSFNATVHISGADNLEKAVKIAKEMVEENPKEYCESVRVEEVTFVNKE